MHNHASTGTKRILLDISRSIFIFSIIMFITDDQPFLPINPFAEPTTTMSSTNPHIGDEDMIDIDFKNSINDKTNSKFNNIKKETYLYSTNR
jgi:hypothetical protein